MLKCYTADILKLNTKWLHVTSNENVGCQRCSQIGSQNVESAKLLHISIEWKSCSVKAHRSNKEILRASIEKN